MQGRVQLESHISHELVGTIPRDLTHLNLIRHIHYRLTLDYQRLRGPIEPFLREFNLRPETITFNGPLNPLRLYLRLPVPTLPVLHLPLYLPSLNCLPDLDLGPVL